MVKQNHDRYHINFMDPLCSIGNVLALNPPRSVLEQSDESKLKAFYKFYAVIILLIIIVGSGASTFGRFTEVYPTFPSATLTVTDVAALWSATLTNIFAIIVPSLFRLEVFKSFFELFTRSEDCLPVDKLVKVKKCKAFYIELAVGHLSLLAICIFDYYVWRIKAGFTIQVYRNYIFQNFQSYHIFINAMIMYNFALSIKSKFQKINDELRQLDNTVTYYSSGNNASAIQVKTDICKNVQIVREIALMYENQIAQINLFNDVYGWQILFMTLSTMMSLINSWDMLTVYLISTQKQKTVGVCGYHLIILHSLWALWQLINGAVVVMSCSKAERSGKETADVCFNQLLKLPIASKAPQDKALRNELGLLSQLAIHRCPSFSAAGFFTVNRSLLLAIFASVTSYIIVLIQLQQ